MRRVVSIEDSVDTSIWQIENYTKKEKRKADYSDQEQHKNQQTNKN